MICGKINNLKYCHSTGDSAKGRFPAHLACWNIPGSSQRGRPWGLFPLSCCLHCCWSVEGVCFYLYIAPYGFVAIQNLIVPLAKCSCWEVERVEASQRILGTSSHGLELHHFWKALPARPCWQWVSQSGDNQNTDVVEGGCCVFSCIRVMFCALDVC